MGEPVARDASGVCEVAAQVDGEAGPEFAGEGVEEHVSGVVVGFGVERRADARVVFAVPGATVRSLSRAPRVAGAELSVFGGAEVDGSEGGRGEGDE
jgi:hypothetical protein